MNSQQLAESFKRIAQEVFNSSTLYKEGNCAVVKALCKEADLLSPKPSPREWSVVIDEDGSMAHFTEPLKRGWSKIKVREVIE